MRRIVRPAIILIVALSTSVAIGQKQSLDPEFSAFWKNFKEVIAKNDKEGVANLTKLPFLYDSKERDRAGFIKIYPQLFTPKARRCIAVAKPLKEQENYDVFCGQIIFYFGKDTDGKYKLLEFGVND